MLYESPSEPIYIYNSIVFINQFKSKRCIFNSESDNGKTMLSNFRNCDWTFITPRAYFPHNHFCFGFGTMVMFHPSQIWVWMAYWGQWGVFASGQSHPFQARKCYHESKAFILLSSSRLVGKMEWKYLILAMVIMSMATCGTASEHSKYGAKKTVSLRWFSGKNHLRITLIPC